MVGVMVGVRGQGLGLGPGLSSPITPIHSHSLPFTPICTPIHSLSLHSPFQCDLPPPACGGA